MKKTHINWVQIIFIRYLQSQYFESFDDIVIVLLFIWEIDWFDLQSIDESTVHWNKLLVLKMILQKIVYCINGRSQRKSYLIGLLQYQNLRQFIKNRSL